MRARVRGRTVTVEETRVRGGVLASRSGQSPAGPVPNPAPAPHSTNLVLASTISVGAFTFTLQGQLPSGKNGIKTTRTGKRYPTKRFVEWREEAINSIYNAERARFPGKGFLCATMYRKPTELCIEIRYAAGDLRRRDIPGMMDALFHVLERARVVEDDAQIKESHWYQLPVDRAAPGVTVTLMEMEIEST